MKWFTRARKFPQLIGRTPDGTRIPGGPYTYTQVFTGIGMVTVLAGTTGLWARGALLFNAAIFVGLTAGAVYLAGQLPPGMRNPLLALNGLGRTFQRGYRINSRPIPKSAPNRATALGPIVTFEPVSEERALEPAPVAEPIVPSDVEPDQVRSRPALTNVQRLLLGEAS